MRMDWVRFKGKTKYLDYRPLAPETILSFQIIQLGSRPVNDAFKTVDFSGLLIDACPILCPQI